MPRKTASAEMPADLMPADAVIASGQIPTAQLVEAAYAMRAQRDSAQAELAKIEAALIARGAGKHSGQEDGHEVTVIAAVPASEGKISYALPAEKEDAAKELALDKFGILFKRTVTFTPIEGFAAVVPTHLTPARSRDLIALCAVQGKGYSGRAASIRYA